MSTSPWSDDLEARRPPCRMPQPPIPAGLEAKLLAAIPDAEARGAPQAERRRWRRRRLTGGLAAAVTLLALAIGSFSYRPNSTEGLPRPQPAARLAAPHPPTLWNARVSDADVASVPYSFEWPVQLTVPSRAQRLQQLTR